MYGKIVKILSFDLFAELRVSMIQNLILMNKICFMFTKLYKFEKVTTHFFYYATNFYYVTS